MAIANKIIKEQDFELKSLLLSNHQIYHHTLKEQKTGNIKYYPTNFELKKESFLELLSKALELFITNEVASTISAVLALRKPRVPLGVLIVTNIISPVFTFALLTVTVPLANVAVPK